MAAWRFPLPLVASAIVLSASLLGATARAGPTDKAGAEILFEQGRRLMESKHFAEACEKFGASHKLDPAVGALLNLGVCSEREGRLATAWGYYREAQALAQSRGDAERERYARETASAIQPRLAKLAIVTANASSASGLEVRKDGMVMSAAAFGTPLPIDAGTHAIEASAPGKRPWTSRVEVPRDGVTVTVDVPALDDDKPAAAALPPVAPPTDAVTPAATENGKIPPPAAAAGSPGLGAQRTAAIVSLGIGVIAVGAASVLALRASSVWQDARPHCNANNLCDDQGYPIAQDARRLGNIATAGLVTGGAALALATVLWVTAPDRSGARATRSTASGLTGVAPFVVGGAGGLSMTGYF